MSYNDTYREVTIPVTWAVALEIALLLITMLLRTEYIHSWAKINSVML